MRDTTPESCEELGGVFAGMDLYCWRGDVQCEVEGRCCALSQQRVVVP